MALKPIHSISALGFIFILLTSFFPLGRVQALNNQLEDVNLPLLNAFVDEVRNGHPDELRGIYIPEILAARVIQQPEKDDGFVSPGEDIITQFGLASQVGSIGLLAHNYLAGESFFLLKEDQAFYLIYGDGEISAFVVTETLRYEALDPTNPFSRFRDLKSDHLLTAAELFSKVYRRRGQVVLQTCISTDMSPSWGRLFVIAEPYRPAE